MSYESQSRFRGRSGPQQRSGWNNNRSRNFNSRRQHSASPSRSRTPPYSRSPSRSPPPHHNKSSEWDCPCNFNRHGDRILVSFARLHGYHGLSEARLFQRLPELDSTFVCTDTLQELLALMLNVSESALRLATPRQIGHREFIASVQLAPGMRVHCQSLSKEGSIRGALLHGILAALDPNTPLPDSSISSVNEFRFPLPPPRPPADLTHLFHAGDPNELFTKNRITELFLHELAELRENSLHPETLADRPDDASASRSLALLGVPQPFVNYSRNGQGDLWQARAVTKHVVACGHGTDVGLARQAALLHLLVLIVRGHQPCPVWDDIKKGSKKYAQIKTLKTTIDDICAQRKARATALDSHRSHRSASARRSRSPSGPRYNASRGRSPSRLQTLGFDSHRSRSRSRSNSAAGFSRQRGRSPHSRGSGHSHSRSSSAFRDHSRPANNGHFQSRDRSPFRPAMHRQRNFQRGGSLSNDSGTEVNRYSRTLPESNDVPYTAYNNGCNDISGNDEDLDHSVSHANNYDQPTQPLNSRIPSSPSRSEPKPLTAMQPEIDHHMSPSAKLPVQQRTPKHGSPTSPDSNKYRTFLNDQRTQSDVTNSSLYTTDNLDPMNECERSAASPTMTSLCDTMERNANISTTLPVLSPKHNMSATHHKEFFSPSGEPIDRIAALESMVGHQNSILLQLQGMIAKQQTTINALLQRERQRIATITAMGGSVPTPPPAPLTFNFSPGSPSIGSSSGPVGPMSPPTGIIKYPGNSDVSSSAVATGDLQDKCLSMNEN